MALKELQHYLDNPDDLPTDPAELAELARLMENPGAGEPEETTEQAEKKSAPAGAEESKSVPTQPKEESQEGKKGEEEEAPIATRDGKRTIPYDVLRTERERRQAAESAVGELSAKVEEITAQLAKGTVAGNTKAEAAVEAAAALLDPEELQALREDFPAFGKVVDGLLSTVDSLTRQVESLTQSENAREVDARKTVAVTVQDHIDANPVLSHLQATDPDLFARAVDLDAVLMKDQKQKFNSLGDRFEKVAEMMTMLYGPFEGIAPAPKEDPPPAKKDPAVSKEAIRSVVEEKVKKATAVPKSLSDLPTGEMPDSNEVEAMENASPAELGDKLMRMTPEQRTAFLNRL